MGWKVSDLMWFESGFNFMILGACVCMCFNDDLFLLPRTLRFLLIHPLAFESSQNNFCSNFSQEASCLCSARTHCSEAVLNILLSGVSPVVLFIAMFPCSLSLMWCFTITIQNKRVTPLSVAFKKRKKKKKTPSSSPSPPPPTAGLQWSRKRLEQVLHNS